MSNKKSSQTIQKKFGLKLRQLRKDRGYSQEAFAFECGLHRTYIGCIERGEKNITLVNIEKIAKKLKVRVEEMFEEGK